MMGGSKGGVLQSAVNPCVKCGERVVTNWVMCTKYSKWMHGSCAKIKRVTTTLSEGFVCEQLVENIIL